MQWRYTLIRTVSRIVCLLPYSLVLASGTIFGQIFYFVAKKQRLRAIAQSRECLNLSDLQAEALIKKQFINLGKNVMEILYLPRLNQENIKDFVTIENAHILDAAVAKKQGVVYLTAHLGNWEWMGAALALYGYPLATIIKKQRNDQYTKFLNEYRENAGIEVFSKGTSEVVSAVKALKQGKILGLLSDQDGGPQGLFVPFFGKMAATHAGAATFALKLGATVVPAFIVRTAKGHKIIVKEPLAVPQTGDREEKIYQFTKLMTQTIEAFIVEYPEEWLWFQKRWNTKPSR